jgi:hypothetical protein
MKTPREATVHDDYQRVESGPPYPSAGLPCDTSMGTCGWPPHYPNATVKYGGVSSNSAAIEATKFMGPYKFRMR